MICSAQRVEVNQGQDESSPVRVTRSSTFQGPVCSKEGLEGGGKVDRGSKKYLHELYAIPRTSGPRTSGATLRTKQNKETRF